MARAVASASPISGRLATYQRAERLPSANSFSFWCSSTHGFSACAITSPPASALAVISFSRSPSEIRIMNALTEGKPSASRVGTSASVASEKSVTTMWKL